MTLGSRLAFAAWRLYRTNSLARRVLTPRLRSSAEKGLARHEDFVDEALPSEAWTRPRPSERPALSVYVGDPRHPVARRLFALLHHWGARYRLVDPSKAGERLRSLGASAATISGPSSEPVFCGAGTLSFVPRLPRGHLIEGEPTWTTLEGAQKNHPEVPYVKRTFGESPLEHIHVMLDELVPTSAERAAGSRGPRLERPGLSLDDRVLLPRFAASPWGCVLPDAIDWLLGTKDWREPLPPLVSARVDDVTGAGGLGWLAALEDHGIRPSIGTLHDEWLNSGEKAVKAIVSASQRGGSVSPHAFSMDRFIWFDAPRGCSFSREAMDAHKSKLAADAKATGLIFGKTLNAHFDVIGSTAIDAAHELGFRYALGEHALDQDWRARPRARDPLGTPLYAYGPLSPEGRASVPALFGFQASGAIASSAAPRSRYDWLRNFLELDAETGKPIRESLDRAGAVRQGVTQLLSALYGGFPAYLLAHEIHLDCLGRELVGELLGEVLREVRTRVPEIRVAAFDELPAACAKRILP